MVLPEVKKETLAVRLRRLRKAADLSQDALGARAGVTGQTVWLIESGRQTRIRQDTAETLAEALGVSDVYLVHGADLQRKAHEQPPIEVYLRETRPGLSESDIQVIARVVRCLEADDSLPRG